MLRVFENIVINYCINVLTKYFRKLEKLGLSSKIVYNHLLLSKWGEYMLPENVNTLPNLLQFLNSDVVQIRNQLSVIYISRDILTKDPSVILPLLRHILTYYETIYQEHASQHEHQEQRPNNIIVPGRNKKEKLHELHALLSLDYI
ncbi:uncharacterized protein BX663DRAFT_541497 [Cokeromyces recurvatus]|uniref:uncharacterized protein n=1 Tax=Cokeromyces recurvatus TaxID=90255 RepID=UPI00221F0901|nr:uncharacterized protein BX663DRAFT_541497 [Cokeromyces recurvatus]KAI7905313.1 hypothetical protein BX663DRAFT_541497 [Cokeromyces recurvatus]